ncbi:RDD family protein [Streptomyces yaizuensis]|uniref:RDD family protein n=1 Tax=Streptomyces yaizuensis TaxID=2989713 RepID=A0ABQ5NSY1_9ACTN|nr:RDD family protein [Streptomyces sp. YSPA8]GLF93477.1 RDD family protein [Streptomyces sp. YSPA8]
MSAPTPAGDGESPSPGYYPDPSIPHYIRYWNGAAWVPGSSRPAPRAGEAMPPLPGRTARQPAARDRGARAGALTESAPGTGGGPGRLEETGPVFLDEEPSGRSARPEPATAWRADASRQSGFGGERDRRVSWHGGTGPGAEPVRLTDPRTAEPRAMDPRTADARTADARTADARGTDSRTGAPRTADVQGAHRAAAPPTDPRLPLQAGEQPLPARPAPATAPVDGPRAEGTLPIRPVRARSGAEPPTDSTLTIRALRRARAQRAEREHAEREHAELQRTGAGGPPGTANAAPAVARSEPPRDADPRAAAHAAEPPPGAPPFTAVPPLVPAPARTVVPPGAPVPPRPRTPSPPAAEAVGDAVVSWSQQVHRLARGAEPEQPPTVPEQTPRRAARERAEARPAGLGRRLTARLLDTVVLGGLVGTVAVPVALRTLAHVDGKIEAARRSGHTVTVWLLDATTVAHLAVVVCALLLIGVVYEALPTARWGRTLGKQLCGITVLDIGTHEPPSFGAALRRWLVCALLGLLTGGAVLDALRALVDRPWRQSWHDRAAHTFVGARRAASR